MTARMLPFPDRTISFQSALDPATGADTAAAPGLSDPPDAAAGEFLPRECPKVQELRRQSKRLREYFKPTRGGEV
jgi:hypothetical protein